MSTRLERLDHDALGAEEPLDTRDDRRVTGPQPGPHHHREEASQPHRDADQQRPRHPGARRLIEQQATQDKQHDPAKRGQPMRAHLQIDREQHERARQEHCARDIDGQRVEEHERQDEQDQADEARQVQPGMQYLEDQTG